MSFFDLFRSNTATDAPARRRAQPGAARKWAAAVSKRAREHERQAAIDALSRIGTEAAAVVLLRRFGFETEPSIIDRDEKESAFKAIVAIGEDALPAVLDHCRRSESLTWPLRILREVLDEEAYVEAVVELLADWDTEYVRNPDPKLHLLSALEMVVDERVRPAVERYLEDVHEPTRFQAVGTLLAQADPQAAGALARALEREEAKRISHRIAEGLSIRRWLVPEAERAPLARALPHPYRLDARGVVARA